MKNAGTRGMDLIEGLFTESSSSKSHFIRRFKWVFLCAVYFRFSSSQ
jgi:hypothetical protein